MSSHLRRWLSHGKYCMESREAPHDTLALLRRGSFVADWLFPGVPAVLTVVVPLVGVWVTLARRTPFELGGFMTLPLFSFASDSDVTLCCKRWQNRSGTLSTSTGMAQPTSTVTTYIGMRTLGKLGIFKKHNINSTSGGLWSLHGHWLQLIK